MPKTKISEFDVDPANNTDINNINIAEGCAPSGINNAIRQLMSDLKEQLTGASGDPFTVGGAFAANGGATLGDASGDALTINSSAVSIPNGLNFDSNTLVIDATNNNVGIGTASPASVLHVSASNATARIASTGANSSTLRFYSNSQTNNQFEIGQGLNTASDNLGYVWNIANAAISFGTNSAERMRIDSSGNVGIGTSSPNLLGASKNLLVQATSGNDAIIAAREPSTDTHISLYQQAGASYIIAGKSSGTATHPLITYVGGAERMRIDSSGYLYVLGVYNGTTGSAANVHVTSSGALFRSTSSLKYKSDVQNATHGLNEVMQLRPVTYKGKSENDGETVFGGLIAEEVHEAGLTEFVQYADDGTPDALSYGNMVALAFKAIQEQQAIITDLKSRIEALENK